LSLAHGFAPRPRNGPQEYQNNLMIKRFLFEAFDCYVSLFYLAFVQVHNATESGISFVLAKLVCVFVCYCLRALWEFPSFLAADALVLPVKLSSILVTENPLRFCASSGLSCPPSRVALVLTVSSRACSHQVPVSIAPPLFSKRVPRCHAVPSQNRDASHAKYSLETKDG